MPNSSQDPLPISQSTKIENTIGNSFNLHIRTISNFFISFMFRKMFVMPFHVHHHFEGVVFRLPLMGLVASGKVNGILIIDVKQVKHFPNFEIGNNFS